MPGPQDKNTQKPKTPPVPVVTDAPPAQDDLGKDQSDQLDDLLDDAIRVVGGGDPQEEGEEEEVQEEVVEDEDVKDEETEETEEVEEEPEEEPEEDEEIEEEEEEEDVDLTTMTRTELKQYIKEKELDVKVYKNMSDEDIRTAIMSQGESDVEQMRKWMNEQARLALTGSQQPQQTQEPAQTPPAQAQPSVQQTPADEAQTLKLSPMTFVSKEEADAIADDPTKINDVLNKVYQKGIQESLIRVLPIMSSQIQTSLALHTMVQGFYQDNPDLQPYKDVVGFVANRVQAEHPDWDLVKVFQETERISRERLRLKREQEASSPKKAKPAKPAFVPKKMKSRPTAPPKVSDMQKDMWELLD
jgi:hypothetical protein